MTSKAKFQKLIDTWGEQLRDKMLEPIFFINEIAGVGVKNDVLTPYQEEWITLLHENKRLNVTACRQTGKTECFGVSYPVFKAFTQPNWTGLVVSDKEEQSKEILQRIKIKIEQNPILCSSVPKNKAISWSKTEINLTNGSRILAKPYTDRLRGWVVNWVLFDEAGEYRDHDVFESNAYAITQARDGSVVVAGTPKSELDLLHNLRKNKAFISEIYAANTKWKDGRTIWQIRYPKTPLSEKKKEVNNNIKFTREFLCKVLSAGDELFPYGVIEASFDYDYGFIDKPIPEYTYYMGLDFALSGESGADYSAYVVYEQNKEGIIRLVKLERYKGLSYAAQKLRIKQLNDIFRPRKVIADEGTFGKAFVQEMRSEHIPLKGFHFQHKRQELLEVFRDAFDRNFSEDKDDEGKHIILPFKERKFLINYSEKDSMCRAIVDKLIEELLGFGVVFRTSRTGDLTGTTKFESMKAHDDLVMACALGYWACRKKRQTEFLVSRGSQAKNKLLFSKT